MKPSAVLVVLQILLISCNTTDVPPGGEPVLRLAALDASCTEVWLEVKLAAGVQPRTLTLQRDTTTILTTTLTAPETLIVDEGLLPNRQYTYTVTREAGLYPDRATSTITTMDTTSHNWTFSIDTLGVTASTLYDVTIINDTLAYAVGEMYLRDSTGQLDPQAYNMAQWNGVSWQFMRIQFFTICGQSSRTPYPAKSVFAFGANDVWIAMDGSQMARWNGTAQTATICMSDPFVINKIWGENPNSIWAVGYGGRIGHYANGTWQRVESGTTLPIQDVYGARDNQSGQYEILCVAEAYGVPGGSKVLLIENASARELTTNGLESWGVEGIWVVPNRQYMVIGQGVWRSASPEGNWWLDNTLPGVATTSISGQSLNDITVCGAFWLLATWNGVRWQTYFPRTGGSFGSVAIKRNMLVAVGDIGNKAVVVRGTR